MGKHIPNMVRSLFIVICWRVQIIVSRFSVNVLSYYITQRRNIRLHKISHIDFKAIHYMYHVPIVYIPFNKYFR